MISQLDIPLSKILTPSMSEFCDFEAFVESFDQDQALQNHGIIKVIPPPKWKPRSGTVEAVLDDLVVSSPIEQNVQGRSGIYELLLIQKKSMKLSEYRKKVECFDHFVDDKKIEEVEDLFLEEHLVQSTSLWC
jgi:hypothetical protein